VQGVLELALDVARDRPRLAVAHGPVVDLA
jgi:hypothetical protein